MRLYRVWTGIALRIALMLWCGSSALVGFASAAGAGIHGEGQIAFVSDRGGDYGQIYALDIQRHITVNLTPHMTHVYEPDWSPDGQQILFYLHADYPSDLYLMDADGSDVRPLTLGRRYRAPSWSPDGQRIIFEEVLVEDLVARTVIQYMNVENGDVRALPPTNPRDMNPDWSPDGQRIVFESTHDANTDLYLMDIDGSSLRRLTDHRATDYAPAWSPDGKTIAFVSDRDGNREIYRLDVNTLAVTRLTHDIGIDGSPAWSPDGQTIAFLSDRDENYDLYLMNADGGNVRRLTSHPSADLTPVWWP